MQDIAKLTPSLFTAKTGIKVNYTILDEGKLREITTRAVGSGGKSFDAVMIGMYETPQFGSAGLLQDLTSRAKGDKAYNFNDLIPAVRGGLSANGKLYASPFYAESSFVMYRKDVLKSKGVTMPARPTWTQVAAIARKVNSSSMAGICLRGEHEPFLLRLFRHPGLRDYADRRCHGERRFRGSLRTGVADGCSA